MGTGEEEEGVDGVIVPQSVETAPETLSLGTGKGLKQGESSVMDNPAYEEMWGAISGPLEAKRGGGTIATGVKNVHTGTDLSSCDSVVRFFSPLEEGKERVLVRKFLCQDRGSYFPHSLIGSYWDW